MESVCSIELLGSLRVHLADRVIDRFQTQKTGALLAYVALHLGKSFRREAIAELLWPEGDPVAIRNRLNQAVSSLRRQLHPPELNISQILVANHHSISLNSAAVSTDLAVFELTLRDAGNLRDRRERARSLERAVSQYGGPFLSGYYDDWVVTQRLRLEEAYVNAIDELIRTYSRFGEPERAIEFAMMKSQLDPQDETTHLTIMELFLRAGKPKSAARQLDEMTTLFNTANIRPSAAVESMRERIRRESRTATTTRLPRAVISGVVTPEEPQPRQANETTRRIPRIPRFLTSFVGRSSELEILKDSIEKQRRLISIVGLGGVGKTRLALELGWQLHESQQISVVFASLAGSEGAGGITEELMKSLTAEDPAFAGVLETREVPGPLLNKRILLIIDNVDENASTTAGIVRELLELMPALTVLCTSRDPLGLDGEMMIDLGPLPLVPLDAELTDVATNSAVRLFVDRAQTVRPDFQVTERTRESILDLCRQLDGLPLALELAAGWVRVLTPAQILDKVKERFDFLESRRKDIEPRQRSMRAAIEYSYRLLDDEAKVALRGLSVFNGSFSRQAAEAVLGDIDVDLAMAGLIERSLLRTEVAGSTSRFQLLETIRTFARNQLSPDEIQELSYLHAFFYSKMLSAQEEEAGSTPIPEMDYSNSMESFRWLAKNGYIDEAAAMVRPLVKTWESRSRLKEGLNWVQWLLNELPEDASDLSMARLVGAEARLRWLLGDYHQSSKLLQSALEHFMQAGALAESQQVRFDLIADVHRRKRFDEAEALLRDGLKIAQELRDLVSESRVWMMLGNVAVEQHRWNDAAKAYDRSYELAASIHHPERMSSALTNAANLAIMNGQAELAQTKLVLAEKYTLESEVYWMIGMLELTKARFQQEFGDPVEGLRCILRGLQFAKDAHLVLWRLLMRGGLLLEKLGADIPAIQLLAYAQKQNLDLTQMGSSVEFVPFHEAVNRLQSRVPEAPFTENWYLGEFLNCDEAIRTLENEVHSKIRT